MKQVILFKKQRKVVRKVAVKWVKTTHPNKSFNPTAEYFAAYRVKVCGRLVNSTLALKGEFMKRFGEKAILSTVLAFVLSISVTNTNANGPSKREFSDIIQEHIAEFYTTFPMQVEVSPFANFKEIRKAEKYGIVRMVLKSGINLGGKNRSFGNARMGDIFKIEITPKGQKIQHFTLPDGKIAFQVMTRKVDEIIQVEADGKDNFTVNFSYIGIPNELGKVMMFDKDLYKWKGRATIKYDIFSKQYLFDNFLWSPWDRLEWGETGWVTVEDGEKVIRSTK